VIASASLASCREPTVDLPNRDPGAPAPHVASIGGFVRDRVTLQPVAGALVQVDAISAISKADGSYELVDIRNAVVTISTSRDGYETMSTLLPLANGHNTRTVLLQPQTAISSQP